MKPISLSSESNSIKKILFYDIFNKMNFNISSDDYCFSLYDLTPESYKDNNRITDCIDSGKIIVNGGVFNITPTDIDVDVYMTGDFKLSDDYKKLIGLFSFEYTTYIKLYVKYILNQDCDWIDPLLLRSIYKLPDELKSRKIFDS